MFQLLSSTNLNQNFWHAIAISLLRGLAALQVVAAHLRAQLFPGLKQIPDPSLGYQALAFVTGFAHQAVVIFFVLSGWLVGGSLLNKWHERHALGHYAIDRLTRMWIVLIPAFGLTLLLAMAAGTVDPQRPDIAADNPYSLASFLGNLVGLQDMAVPRFGNNFALWSLSNEMWYYVLFPLLMLGFIGASWQTRWLAAAAAVLIASQLSERIVLYFTVWLLGAAFSRLRIALPRKGLAVLAALFLALAVLFRLTGRNDILETASFLQDLLYSVVFLALLCCLQHPADLRHGPARLLKRAGEWLAAFSFTLYVIHVPLLLTIRASLLAPLMPHSRLAHDRVADFAIYFLLLAAIVLLAWLFHLPFEAQTNRLRRAIKQALYGPERKAVAAGT